MISHTHIVVLHKSVASIVKLLLCGCFHHIVVVFTLIVCRIVFIFILVLVSVFIFILVLVFILVVIVVIVIAIIVVLQQRVVQSTAGHKHRLDVLGARQTNWVL